MPYNIRAWLPYLRQNRLEVERCSQRALTVLAVSILAGSRLLYGFRRVKLPENAGTLFSYLERVKGFAQGSYESSMVQRVRFASSSSIMYLDM